MKPTEDKEAMLTPEEVILGRLQYYGLSHEPLSISHINKINKAILEKLERLGYERKG